MLSKRKLIGVGDAVMMYTSRSKIQLIHIKPNGSFNSKRGHYPHRNLIGVEYGSKVYNNKGTEFMYALRPTPEMWCIALTNRTEILYPTDISMITLYLELQPGSIVVESGTGSGNLSTSIARTIAPHGRLFTYEYHKGRYETALEDFEMNQLSHLITCHHADVCNTGFGLEDGSVDAVFLDLPRPWLALQAALNILKPYGKVCCFSPCIEQVQKTCETIKMLGYEDPETIECLLRPQQLEIINGDIYTGKRGRNRMAGRQRNGNRCNNDNNNNKNKNKNNKNYNRNNINNNNGETRKRSEDDASDGGTDIEPVAKRQKLDTLVSENGPEKEKLSPYLISDSTQFTAPLSTSSSSTTTPVTTASVTCFNQSPSPSQPISISVPAFPCFPPPNSEWMVSKPLKIAKGHSGYLTFARKQVIQSNI